MFKRISFVLIFTLCLFGFVHNSFAAGYWGFGGGITTWNITPLNGATAVENGPTLEALIGYRSGNLAMEGEVTVSKHDWVSNSDNYYVAGNLIFAGLFFVPLNDQFELYLKAGADFWNTTVHISNSNYDGDDGVAATLGVGAMLRINKNFSLRLEYKHMNDIADGVDEGDLGQTTLLAVFDI